MARLAAVQLISGNNLDANLARLVHWIKVAGSEGADLVVFPENALFFAPAAHLAINDERPRLNVTGAEIQSLQAAATANQIEVIIGSFPEISPDQNKRYNTSLLLYPASPGRAVPPASVSYRKIHLFDAVLPNGEVYAESSRYQAGGDVVVAYTRCGTAGFSICYDLRFPELYRKLVNAGAEVLMIPSAFTYETGKEHWTTLLKARAIENLAYVVAAAQTATPQPGRRCYGHTTIIDPWGSILAELPNEEEGIVFAEINLDYLRHVRQQFPCLQHRKFV